MEEWIQEENVNHCLVNGETHYTHHCYIPLEVNNQVLGTLELHNNVRELGAECLTFCCGIADLLAEIIFLQRTTPASQNLNGSTIINVKIQQDNNSCKPEVVPNPDLLLKLAAQAPALSEITELGEFISQAAKLFLFDYEKIKTQLDEIDTYKKQLENEKLYLHEDTRPTGHYPEIIGEGQGMKKVFGLLDQVAGSESTVLILGETGTGKELIARAIHEGSARKDKAMVKVNCAAIPENLIESELFGHEKGAFTGATDRRIGKFELADNGTLFLDEIGELPLILQVKLLRVLQEKEIERVGGKATIKTDVRIISATNKNLLAEVEKGRFRRDLYYRLHVFPVSLPSLRERAEDIPLLATHFLAKYAHKAGKQLAGFTRGAIQQMSNYSWPGNVREMEHLIERQVLLSKKTVISVIDLPTKEKTITDNDGVRQKIKTIDENERDHIFAVLQICKGRISGPEGAAKLLGVPATTLNSKIKRLGLSKKHF
ncbi:sigma-54 dependent transcriptional regulator [Mucilaginibacter sp. BJC16-A38]|nr:sigma-54 dependent transcriptional regulator [Mucilaginibacter phenanthrenivorans]